MARAHTSKFLKFKPNLSFAMSSLSVQHRNRDESLLVQRFEDLPSSSEFESLIESRNVPAVFTGCIKEWKAFAKWNPSNGGLDYLQERVGSCNVEAMLSRSAPVFYGDLRSHERVLLPFSTFIGYCKQRMQTTGCGHDVSSGLEGHGETELEHAEDAPGRIYLAQVPVMNVDNEERVRLESLREYIELPPFLERKELAFINLWMNNAEARSSTHYDPHHNFLCVVGGCKQEVLKRKFDEMDQRIPEEDRNKFYQVFYGAFDVQFNAIDAILNGKESFALKAFKNMLDKYVGVNFNGPKPGVK